MQILSRLGEALKSGLRRNRALRYMFPVLLACLGAALQLGVQWLNGTVDDASAYEFFLGATALSAVWGGRLSAFVTLCCSTLFKLYLFLPPFGSMRIDSTAAMVRLLLFLAIGSLISIGGGALYASQETLSSTLSSIGDAVVATDDKKLVRFMNPVAESLSGWMADKAVGRSIHDVLHFMDEKTLASIEPPIDATLQQGVVGHLASSGLLVSNNGRCVPIADSISPILGASEHPRGAIMVFRDVTEQRRAENGLRESEGRYRFLAETVPEFIFTTDFRAECNYYNQRWYDYTGLTVEQTMGQGWMAALHPEDLPQVSARWAESVQAGKPYEIEYRLRSREGKYRWFLARGFPMRDEQGNILRWFGISTDVEDFKRTQEQLHQAMKMEAVGRLAGGVAHDFNNLLMVIMGYGKMLSDSAERSGASSSQAQQILYAAERASELTRQLLTFSRQQISQPRLLNLNSILRETETMLRRLIGEDIEVRTVLDPELLPVRIDRGQIEQVIVNLAVNARDAMPGGGQLILETANVTLDDSYILGHLTVEPGRYVMLVVSDTGQGMDHETQAHIFEPFFTTKSPETGTGLGLSIVYGIIKQNGGHISTYSEPGKGTTFRIYFPAVLEIGSDPQQATLPVLMQTRGTETILVLEDDAMVRKLVLAILAQQSYSVLEADRPEEALRQCKEHGDSIHLLITDVVMPGMSGREVAKKAVQYCPALKVLYMSGYTGGAIAQHDVADSPVAFLQKPFSAASLLQKVREVLTG